ncbi:MAG: hypothetical protein J7605_17235 [Variovorax sp.]|nr:hypothetical protein [Variovorax sp.]
MLSDSGDSDGGDWAGDDGNGDPAARELVEIVIALRAAGHVVYETGNGFIVARWGRTLELPDFAALRAFAARVTGARP